MRGIIVHLNEYGLCMYIDRPLKYNANSLEDGKGRTSDAAFCFGAGHHPARSPALSQRTLYIHGLRRTKC